MGKDGLFKVLQDGRRAWLSGWVWPQRKRWTPYLNGQLIHCERGYHLATHDGLVDFLHQGLFIYRAEAEQIEIRAGGEVVCRRARLVELLPWDVNTARRFAADCAQRALERERDAGREPHPDSWRAVEVAYAHAAGEATDQQLNAAGAAAGAAASAAAGDAAGAARDAARDAAGAAGAAWDAESEWQTQRLHVYLEAS